MAKPILTVKLPYYDSMDSKRIDIIESYTLDKVDEEYHVIVFMGNPECKDVEFQVFNVQDVTPINFKELKELVKQHING